jgi:hypothetical protein
LKQQSTPTTLTTPYGDGRANSHPVVPEVEKLSKTSPRPSVRTSETLVGSGGKVRLTRAALLKQQSTPPPQQEVDHVVKVVVVVVVGHLTMLFGRDGRFQVTIA